VSLESLIDFLAYLEPKLWMKKQKLYSHKRCPWVYYTLFIYGHHSPADWARELFKPHR